MTVESGSTADGTNQLDHSDGSAVLTAVSGNTIIPDPDLVFSVTSLGGQFIHDNGDAEGSPCHSSATLSAPSGGLAYFMLDVTPEVTAKVPWGHARMFMEALISGGNPQCSQQDGLIDVDPFDAAYGLSTMDLPYVFPMTDQDPQGGRFHLLSHEHYGMSEPFVVNWNALGGPQITDYDITIDTDLHRIPKSSPYSQYPSFRVHNDARGRDVLKVASEGPVPRGEFVLYAHKPGTFHSRLLFNAQLNAHGKVRLVATDKHPSRIRCYQFVILDNRVTLPGNTLLKCLR